MAICFFLSTASSCSASLLLPRRREPAAAPSNSFPLKPRRFPALSRIPPNPPRFSRILTSSCKAPTAGVVSSVATASRTLVFLLAASLLSFSGVRPPPAVASAPPPTQQPQEIGEQGEQQESEESKKPGEQKESEGSKQQGEQQQPEESKKHGEQQESEESKQQGEQQESEESKQQDERKESEESKQLVEDDVKKSEEVKEIEEEVEADDEMKMYSEILSQNPGDVDALKCMLYAKMKRADWGGALQYARRLREAEPGEEEWRLTEAQLHELKGDLDEAERQYREVLAENPLLVRALHGLALCMRKRLEGPSAFEMLENALQFAVSEKRVPEERNIKLLIAQMHVVKGELDVALDKLQKLIDEDPRDFRPHLCQGIVFALLDKKEEADVQFDIYRSLVPDEFPDKSVINDIILAAKTESNDRLRKELGCEFLWGK